MKILLNLDEILNQLGKKFFIINKNQFFFDYRITQNQTSIAIVERNSQSVHIFDKQTKEQIDEIQNLLRTEGTFRLWNVLVSLFNQNKHINIIYTITGNRCFIYYT